jgi:hypothetical protein
VVTQAIVLAGQPEVEGQAQRGTLDLARNDASRRGKQRRNVLEVRQRDVRRRRFGSVRYQRVGHCPGSCRRRGMRGRTPPPEVSERLRAIMAMDLTSATRPAYFHGCIAP